MVIYRKIPGKKSCEIIDKVQKSVEFFINTLCCLSNNLHIIPKEILDETSFTLS